MTTPFWCLLAAVAMPYLLAFTGTYFRKRELGTVDNRNPRQQALQLTGAGARCYAAQQNAWEALAVFTAAVVTAHLFQADPADSSTAALVFVAGHPPIPDEPRHDRDSWRPRGGRIHRGHRAPDRSLDELRARSRRDVSA